MVAEFAIYPMGEVHFSEVIAKMIEELKSSGIAYRIGPMGTSIEGEPTQVFEVLERCFEFIDKRYKRVIMNITLDNKPSIMNQVMDGMVESVLSKVEGHSQHF